MAWRAAKRWPPGCEVDVRRRHRGSWLHRTRREGQCKRQRDRVAEVNGRALGQSTQAVGRVGGWREHQLWPPMRRLQKDENQNQKNQSEEKLSAYQKQSRYSTPLSLPLFLSKVHKSSAPTCLLTNSSSSKLQREWLKLCCKHPPGLILWWTRLHSY